MDHVRVHYNSSQPAQLNALAYAQGSEIHVAPGQEQHLPHEAWHVVQQAQGRVRPTLQLKDGVPVNDDVGLEREADVMGAKALERGPRADGIHGPNSIPISTTPQIEGGTTNSPDVTVANNDSANLANGRGSARQGGVELQRMADQRPQAALQGEVDGRAVETKKLDLTPGSAGSVRVVAQARYLDGLFGAAQLRPDPANASFSQVKKNDRAFGTTLQRRRDRDASAEPPSSMRRWLDRDKGSQTYIQYANIQYDINKNRAEKIIPKIVDSLGKSSSSGAQNSTYCPPDEKQWQVSPEPGSNKPFPKFGLRIEYNHRTLMHAEKMSVRYHTTFKRNRESGKVDMTANDNRAPAPAAKQASKDSVLNMNLNQIWAHQLQYFLQLESIAEKIQNPLGKLSSIKRSQIENPSTLATYWITNKAEDDHKDHKVDDEDDWLALSGSPNGNALLWLILQSPSLGEPLDVEAIKKDPTCMYNIEVREGPTLIFN
jgi:hypothetical protein